MTQADAVLDHLKNNKGLTSKEAFEKYGVTRLSAKVFELKKKGYEIVCFPRTGVDRFGHKTRYGEYRLVGAYDFK